MRLRFILLQSLIVLSQIGFAQQWALYNTNTLFDSFENPSQRSFFPDSSRRYAFNFFIPNGGLTAKGNGPADLTIRNLFYTGNLQTSEVDLAETRRNNFIIDQNTYLFMFRMLRSVRYNREFGFSWQVRSDLDYQLTNQTFVVLNNYQQFPTGLYDDVFNDKGYGISYHQFSLSYRENYNRRLAFGAKLSYLSGIGYSKLSIQESDVSINRETRSLDAHIKGYYRSNFLANNFDKQLMVPHIRNPGFALSLSANYKMHGGWYILGNLKDLGLIYWRRTPYLFQFDQTISLNNTSGNSAGSKIRKQIEDDILDKPSFDKFITPINSKAELLVNKDFNNYQPNLIISKSLLNRQGYVAMVNTYRRNVFNASLTTAYSFRHTLEVGGQLMLKSPNAEFYLGSDNFFKSINTAKGVAKNDASIGRGYTAASAYLGFTIKFGPTLERRPNANTIPGIKSVLVPGFFDKLFKKKRRRKA